MLHQEQNEQLDCINADQSLDGQWVGLQEVEVVMEAAGVQGWENEVDRLDQGEPGVVVELPARVCEEI